VGDGAAVDRCGDAEPDAGHTREAGVVPISPLWSPEGRARALSAEEFVAQAFVVQIYPAGAPSRPRIDASNLVIER
jgi:hypothetical protein